MRNKYRVWDKQEFKFIEEPCYVGENGIVIDLGKELTDCADEDRLEENLFSGKKDVEGNEIYEQDVIKMTNGKHTIYGRVICDDFFDGFWVDYTTICGEKGHSMPLWEAIDPRSQMDNWEPGIVVGNAYENSELLDAGCKHGKD